MDERSLTIRDIAPAVQPPQYGLGFDETGQPVPLRVMPGCSSDYLPVLLIEEGPGTEAMLNSLAAQFCAARCSVHCDRSLVLRHCREYIQTGTPEPGSFDVTFQRTPLSSDRRTLLVKTTVLSILSIDRACMESFVERRGGGEVHLFAVPGEKAFEYTCPGPDRGVVRLPESSGVVYPPGRLH